MTEGGFLFFSPRKAVIFAPFMDCRNYIVGLGLLLSVGFGAGGVEDSTRVIKRTELSDKVIALDLGQAEEESRFDILMEEARLIFVDAIVADKSADTLEAAYTFDLLFEALADIEQLPMLDEIQRLEFNRFLNATISFYENDSQTLEKIETSLTVSALRDALSNYTREFPTNLSDIPEEVLNKEGHIPIVYNRRVARIIQFFQTEGRRSMQAWLNRLPRYQKLMEPILEEENAPRELIFLAMVESGLNPRAYSWKHAVGPWQFISSTGRQYGLRRDWWRDERRDYLKSTRAAARHLKDLYSEFDDWYLSFAAYNAGAGRVRRAIRIHQSTDFWRLNVLPRQTRNYVPNIVAAFLIAQDPEKYGFEVNPEPMLEWEVVEVNKSLSFEILAQITECSTDTLRMLNPELRQNQTPPAENGETYPLRIPKGSQDLFERNYGPIASQVEAVLADVMVQQHKVRRGESLYSISKRYGVPMVTIAKANNLRNWHQLSIGQRLDIPVPTSGVAFRQGDIPSNPDAEKVYYTVRPGDTLSEIAEMYRVGLSVLRRWNGIRPGSGYIRIGQKLVIWKPAQDTGVRPGSTSQEGNVYYTVRPGDTLSEIAERFGVGLPSIRRWNKISNRSSYIRVGQKLVVGQTSATPTLAVAEEGEISSALKKIYYTVRPGDSLSEIARSYQVPLSNLRSWNGLGSGSSLIHSGQTLVIWLEP